MRSLLTFLAFALLATPAFALRCGPFDSASSISGLDRVRGTYETVVRGKNLILVARYSASSSFDSYGSSIGFSQGVGLSGSANASIDEGTSILFFNASGSAAERSLRITVAGFLDQKATSSGYPYRAQGTGKAQVTLTRQAPNLLQQIQSLGLDVSFDLEITSTAQIASLLETDAVNPSEIETEEISVTGETKQISVTPTPLQLTVTDRFGSAYPIYINPNDSDRILEIITTINQSLPVTVLN